jgi:hypothetical protein
MVPSGEILYIYIYIYKCAKLWNIFLYVYVVILL